MVNSKKYNMGSEQTKGGFFRLLMRLWWHLTQQRRRQFILLLVLMFIGSVAEVFSLGMVIPFIAILTKPENIFNYPGVSNIAQLIEIDTAEQLVLPLTIVFVLAALVAGSIRLLLLWANTRLSYACGADISLDVYRRTLYQPYCVHVNLNSSEVISSIVSKVNSVTSIVSMTLQMISSLVLLIFFVSLIMIINPMVALIAAISLGGGYAGISWIIRLKLKENGDLIAKETTSVVKALQEGLGGIRDVLLDGTQSVYCDIYRQSDIPLRRAQGNIAFISASPRFVMDTLGIVLISTLAYTLSRTENGITSALPVLGALVLGAQRVLPALQQIYHAWANIFGGQSTLNDILRLLDQDSPGESVQIVPQPINFNIFRFDSVDFRYMDDSPWVINNLSLDIRKGSRIGFVGSTGSGKSTTVDLLMGLLVPTQGQILVNNKPLIGEHCRAWQQTIAHVPQNIYLSDNTIAENIAFGVPISSIDIDRVKWAADQAQISEFIESKPEGYYATVGERGIQLSGGQRQRIGIARALYKNATVLVLDEATSALDNMTEQAVMDAINNLTHELTVILIAHRLSTVRHCDVIVELEKGHLVSYGTYEQLLKFSPSFSASTKLSN